MQQNVGSVDRIVRVIIGIILLSFLVFLESNIKYVGLIGVVLIITAVFKFCPLYVLLRKDTNSNN